MIPTSGKAIWVRPCLMSGMVFSVTALQAEAGANLGLVSTLAIRNRHFATMLSSVGVRTGESRSMGLRVVLGLLFVVHY